MDENNVNNPNGAPEETEGAPMGAPEENADAPTGAPEESTGAEQNFYTQPPNAEFGGGFNQAPPPQQQPPGYGQAVASMVLGIVAVALWFFRYTSIVSIALGIVGIVLASKSKSLGYEGGMRTAGFVLSIVAVAGGVVFFISCVACVGCLGAARYAYY